MRIRLLRPPPLTIRLDRDYRIDPVWMAAADSGYLAAHFASGHWKLTKNYTPRAALDSAWSTGAEILDAPWPRAIAQALLRDGLAEPMQ